MWFNRGLQYCLKALDFRHFVHGVTKKQCQHFCGHAKSNTLSGLFFARDQSTNSGKSARERKINVCVEGNIGSGKTTFLKQFAHFDSHVELIDEPVKHWRDFGGQNPLACLYAEPERWAFTFQSLVQLTLLQCHDKPQTKPLRIMERSILSARYCFAENHRQNGLMSDMEYAILNEWFHYVVQQHQVKVDLVVYLQVSPEVCLRRIQARNRPEEQIVSLDYLTALHRLHENWLIHPTNESVIRPPVMIIDGNHDLSTMQSKFPQLRSQLLSRLMSMPG